MKFLDTAGLTSLWGKVKELTAPIAEASEGVAVTKPATGEVLTVDVFTKLKNAVDNKYKITVVEQVSDVKKTTICVYQSATTDTITLCWVDGDVQKLVTCNIDSTRKVTITELDLKGGSSASGDTITIKLPQDENLNIKTGEQESSDFYQTLYNAVSTKKNIFVDISMQGEYDDYAVICPASACTDIQNSTTITLLFLHPDTLQLYRYDINVDDDLPYVTLQKIALTLPKMYTINVAEIEAGVTSLQFNSVLNTVKNAMINNVPLYAIRNESNGGENDQMQYRCPITISYYGNIKNGVPQFKNTDVFSLTYYYWTGDHVSPASMTTKTVLKCTIASKSITQEQFQFVAAS